MDVELAEMLDLSITRESLKGTLAGPPLEGGTDRRKGDGNLYTPYRSLASSASSHEIWAVWPLESGYGRESILNSSSLK